MSLHRAMLVRERMLTMGVRFVVVSMLAVLTAASSICAAEPPSSSIEKIVADAFAQASIEHSVIKTTTVHDAKFEEVQPWSLDSRGLCLNRSDALEGLIKRITEPTQGNKANTVADYCVAAKHFIKDDRADYRALACELLGHFQTEMAELGLIPEVGNVLDDDAFAFGGMHRVLPQSGRPWWEVGEKMAVADVARWVLVATTGIQFPSKEEFLAWWQNNSAYRERIWYWQVRWCAHKASDDLVLLERIDPHRALKIMLLVNNPSALRAEAGSTSLDVRSSMVRVIGPKTDAIADFIRQNNLKQTLLAVLSGSVVWPELQIDQYSRMGFVNKISDLSTGVFERADAKALEGILNSGEGLLAKEPQEQATIALLAARLEPERHDEIVLSQLKRNADQPSLAVDAIQRTSLKHWELIKTTFGRSRDYEQETIIDALGSLKDSAARKALGELMASQDLTVHLNQWGRRTPIRRRGCSEPIPELHKR